MEINKYIDLSHVIEQDISLFSQTVPKPQITTWKSHSETKASGNYKDCSCEITQVNFITSLGTYIDSPYHFNPLGQTIDQLQLDQLILPGIVINCQQFCLKQGPISVDSLKGQDIKGKAVLFYTGQSQYWKQDKYMQHPYLTKDIAMYLIENGAKLAGVDFLVVDDFNDPTRPVHSNLLKNNILIAENLSNLSSLPQQNFTFFAVPTKIKGAAAFPVRAFAIINQ